VAVSGEPEPTLRALKRALLERLEAVVELVLRLPEEPMEGEPVPPPDDE
jgi:hypothetical protein